MCDSSPYFFIVDLITIKYEILFKILTKLTKLTKLINN